jgi:hypothetical protein
VLWLALLWKIALRLELAAEWDSNANRAEIVAGANNPDTPTPSFLLRSTARLAAAIRTPRNQLRLAGLIGGKVFFDGSVQDQNVIVGQLTVDDRLRLRRNLEGGLSADYYDATQQSTTSCAVVSCDRHRDFRAGGAAVRLVGYSGPAALTAQLGYRGFQWKPDESFNFNSVVAAVNALLRLPAGRDGDLDVHAAYQLERRWYRGYAVRDICPPGATLTDNCLAYDTSQRRDYAHEARLEVTWVGPVLLSLGSSLQLISSSSFGQSLLRNQWTLKLAFRIPGHIYVTLKGQLLVSRYLDPVLLDRQVNSQTLITIEDENRNAVIADVERPFGKTGLALAARYSLFTNELGSSTTSFMRQVVSLGLSWKWER